MSELRSDVISGFSSKTFKDDLFASVVVFLVALPLCIGIALASGVPPDKAATVGIITGVVGGLVVGLIGGAPLQVSGPAAGLSVIIWEAIEYHGWENMWVVVVVAGLFQLLAGSLRMGQWFRAVSPAVIYGMLSGIGVLIFASQFHYMVDDEGPGGGLSNLMTIPDAIYKGLFSGQDEHQWAARVGLITIMVVVGWKVFVPRKLQLIPGPLVAILVATFVTVALGLDIKQLQLDGNFFAGLHIPHPEQVRDIVEWEVLILDGLAVGLIASAETLLSASAVDKMHAGPRTRYDRELTAQGVGNTVSGLIGGLPMTGVIVRSSANVLAGARSRLSAVLHAFWLLLFAGFLTSLLAYIPRSALAALLVYTGYKLVDVAAVKRLWKTQRSEVFIYAVTVTTIVAVDLLTGVVAGVILSALKLLYTFSHLDAKVEDDPVSKRTLLLLEGTATFIRLPKLAGVLEEIPGDRELHVNFEHLEYIDHACLDLLLNSAEQRRATGGSLVLDWQSLTARFRAPGDMGGKGPNGSGRPPGQPT